MRAAWPSYIRDLAVPVIFGENFVRQCSPSSCYPSYPHLARPFSTRHVPADPMLDLSFGVRRSVAFGNILNVVGD
jgi:hypothetical protein